MHAHPDTSLSFEELGSRVPAYAPTYEFSGPYIDTDHAALARAPITTEALIQLRRHRWLGGYIPGWLRREDALKLYELAYFSQGPILELGSYHGLSTTILARASRNAHNQQPIHTVDLDPAFARATRKTLRALGLGANVRVTAADAVAVVDQYAVQGSRLGFVFVDHSHEYEPVRAVCQRLAHVMKPGAFCLFHDFNDSRNRDPHDPDYGVFQAVQDGLDHNTFQFYGIYGCTGLFRTAP